MYCKTCDYLLPNGPEHRCPECGLAFDPQDSSTLNAETRREIVERRMGRVALSIGFIVFGSIVGLFLVLWAMGLLDVLING